MTRVAHLAATVRVYPDPEVVAGGEIIVLMAVVALILLFSLPKNPK